MTEKEVLQELEKLGTAQNRKIYKRHGASDNLYGVSFIHKARDRKENSRC